MNDEDRKAEKIKEYDAQIKRSLMIAAIGAVIIVILKFAT